MATTYSLNSASTYDGRKLVLTATQTKNIATNKSTINWTLTSTGGNVGYYSTGPTTVYINGVQVYYSARKEWNTYQFPAGTGSVSGSLEVEHTSDGSKTISCSLSTAIWYGSVQTASSNWTLDSIPRQATINSFTGNNLEGSFKAMYTSYTSAFTYKIKLSIPNVYTLQTMTYTSGTNTALNSSSLTYIKNYMNTNGINKINIGAVIETWNGSTKIGESAELINECYFTDANPTIGTITYQDINSSVVAITTNNQHIVQNKSTLQVNYTSATAKKGASILRHEFVLNGVTKTSTSTSGSVSFGVINSSSNLTLTITAIDNRGNSTSTTKTITMLPYSIPNAIVTLNRLNNYEDTTYLTVDGSVASVNSKNTMEIKYRYKQSGGSYGSYTNINDNTRQTLSLNKNNEYIFNIVVTDAFNETYNKEFVLGKGVFPLFIDTVLNSVGINGFPTHSGALEVFGDIFKDGLKIIDSGSNVNGSYTKFPDGTLICNGYKKINASIPVGTGQTFDITLPFSMVDINYTPICTKAYGGSGYAYLIENLNTRMTTKFSIYIWNNGNIQSEIDGYFWIAIGKWK